jgi:hypothetical protein
MMLIKTRKILIALALVAMMLSTVTAFAAESPSEIIAIQPFWTNTSNVNVVLSISGTTANCSAIVEGYSGTTKIVADVTLERKAANGTYTTVKTWTNQSANGSRLLFDESYSVTSGYTYRLTVSAKVTRNGTTETASNWVEKTA